MPDTVDRTVARRIVQIARQPKVAATPVIRSVTPQIVATPTVAIPVPEIIIPDRDPTRIPIEFHELTFLRAIRPDDLFNGIFRFYNLHRNSLTNRAQKIDGAAPAFLALDLPGQHIGEEALGASGGVPLPLRARMAGRSRIVVEMPQGAGSVRVELEPLLEALALWPLSLDPLARYTGGGVNRDMLETAERTFVGLSLLLWAQLAELGIAWIMNRAQSAGNRLVDENYQKLLSGRTLMDMLRNGSEVRQAVEAEGDTLVATAVGALSNPSSDETEAARDVTEATLEVYFALTLARRLLAEGDTVTGTQLWGMSGLMDLLMHPHPPHKTSTALELPYRLITSPGRNTAFQHPRGARSKTFDAGLRSELWTSTLKRRAGLVDEDLPEDGADFFAMWSPDYLPEPNPPGPGFQMSLDADTRRHLVQRTTGHNEESTTGAPYQPVPAKVRNLVLSPLGATLDAEGAWSALTGYGDFGNLVGWTHQTQLGRDDKVVVLEAGWLYPLGFPVTQVELTERKFQQAGAGGPRVAVLRKRTFLVVGKSVLRFPEDGQENAGRALPFDLIEAHMRVTPDLDTNDPVSGVGGAYWVKRHNGGRLAMPFSARDDAGRRVSFESHQIFVPHDESVKSVSLSSLDTAWRQAGTHRQTSMAGQVVRMKTGNHPELDLPLDAMTLGGARIGGNVANAVNAGKRPFHPKIEEAQAVIPGVEDLTGHRAPTASVVRYTTRYLENRLNDVKQRVILELPNPVELNFADDLKSDAMGAIGQASQWLGAIAEGSGILPLARPDRDLEALISGSLNWQELLPDFKVLGRFALHLLLRALDVRPENMPSFETTRSSQELRRGWTLDEQILESDFEEGPIRLYSLTGASRIFLETFVAITLDTLEFEAAAGGQSVAGTVPTNVRDPRAEAHGRIDNIAISLFDLIEVRFFEIAFDAVAGRKPDARVLLDVTNPLVFKGPLEFLEELKNLIPPAGFGDGPRIVPGPLGIEAGFDLGLPNVEIGVFALKNMTLGAAAVIPFDQRPIDLRFNFNERHRPFEIAVAGFGGGGFFALALDAEGIREIEAALEFGASASMSIGVASGSVSVKGGVYFRYRIGDLLVEGYVELRGRMSVMGLIKASLLFHMALAYQKRNQRAIVRGEATLRVEVEVLFFSASVTLHVEREFEAGAADPRFIEMVSASAWTDYCDAFA